MPHPRRLEAATEAGTSTDFHVYVPPRLYLERLVSDRLLRLIAAEQDFSASSPKDQDKRGSAGLSSRVSTFREVLLAQLAVGCFDGDMALVEATVQRLSKIYRCSHGQCDCHVTGARGSAALQKDATHVAARDIDLLENGPSVDRLTTDLLQPYSLMHFAAVSRNARIIELLMRNIGAISVLSSCGAAPCTKSFSGTFIPVIDLNAMVASGGGNKLSLELKSLSAPERALLPFWARTSPDGLTPIHVAASEGVMEVVETLWTLTVSVVPDADTAFRTDIGLTKRPKPQGGTHQSPAEESSLSLMTRRRFRHELEPTSGSDSRGPRHRLRLPIADSVRRSGDTMATTLSSVGPDPSSSSSPSPSSDPIAAPSSGEDPSVVVADGSTGRARIRLRHDLSSVYGKRKAAVMATKTTTAAAASIGKTSAESSDDLVPNFGDLEVEPATSLLTSMLWCPSTLSVLHDAAYGCSARLFDLEQHRAKYEKVRAVYEASKQQQQRTQSSQRNVLTLGSIASPTKTATVSSADATPVVTEDIIVKIAKREKQLEDRYIDALQCCVFLIKECGSDFSTSTAVFPLPIVQVLQQAHRVVTVEHERMHPEKRLTSLSAEASATTQRINDSPAKEKNLSPAITSPRKAPTATATSGPGESPIEAALPTLVRTGVAPMITLPAPSTRRFDATASPKLRSMQLAASFAKSASPEPSGATGITNTDAKDAAAVILRRFFPMVAAKQESLEFQRRRRKHERL